MNLGDCPQRAAPLSGHSHHRVDERDEETDDSQVSPIEGTLCPAELFGGDHECSHDEPGDEISHARRKPKGNGQPIAASRTESVSKKCCSMEILSCFEGK
ncbi:MAG: hypothetical protein DME19_19615 [Verrucomicrobia bacterium]|nr:MAG: hypothetical protein DME19_19615 [Verrucomicrobiota bacterium]